jgi:hypothetical protein
MVLIDVDLLMVDICALTNEVEAFDCHVGRRSVATFRSEKVSI